MQLKHLQKMFIVCGVIHAVAVGIKFVLYLKYLKERFSKKVHKSLLVRVCEAPIYKGAHFVANMVAKLIVIKGPTQS